MLLEAALDWHLGDREQLGDLAAGAEALARRVEELSLSLDADLSLRAAPVAKGGKNHSAWPRPPRWRTFAVSPAP